MREIIAICSASLLLTGCVTASELDALIPQNSEAISVDSRLYQSVTVQALPSDSLGAFSGQVSDENLAYALESALRQKGMLAQMKGKYTVLPSLVHLKQPAVGLDMTVTANVSYIVRDGSGKVVMDETISTPYTAKMADAFVGVTRVRMANEGAIRENIAAFINAFSEFDIMG